MSRAVRRMRRITGLSVAIVAAAGCATTTPGPAQIDALHARRYDAPPDVTFAAAANALIDMGYHVGVTDGDGGILRAERRRDPSFLEHALWLTVSTAASMGAVPLFAPTSYFTMCILIAPDHDEPRSVVRFEVFKDGRQVAEEKRLDELWIRIERRLLTAGYGVGLKGTEGPGE